MRRYGMRIGTTGVEFASKDERDKALLTFTKGSTVHVNEYAGIIYKDEGDPAFGTYEREANEVLVRCEVCKGTFSHEGCHERGYRVKQNYRDHVTTEHGWICDGCHAVVTKDADLFEAKEKLAAAGA